MSKKKSTLATAAVIAGIATVGVTAGEQNVHADTVAANAQTQDATAQYQAAQKQADQANSADAAKTDAAIADQQKQEDTATAALRQANDQKYDAKSQAVASNTAAQNSAADSAYQASSAALVQSESADVKNQQAANDKAYNDMAAKAITEDQYNAKMTDAKAGYDKNVNKINTEIAVLQKANDQKYDAKSQVVASNTAAQNSAATKNYQASSAALVQSESADVKNQQAANDKAYNDMAAKAITEDQYNAKMSDAKAGYNKIMNKINTDAQKATNDAGTVRENAKKAATDKADAATKNAEKAKQDKINAQKAANKQAIDNAQNNYDNAVKNAPRIAERDATPANGRVDGLTDFGKDQARQQREADNRGNGIKGTSAPFATNVTLGDFDNFDGFFDDSVKDNYVSNENELPMTFKPGLIQYDGSHDTSEKINGQLTEDQMKRLNELSVHWMNELRHEWYNNGYLTAVGKPLNSVFKNGIMDLATNENVWNAVKQLGQDRTNAKYPYMHTGTDTRKPSVKSYSDYTRDYAKSQLDPAIIKASQDTGVDYKKVGNIYYFSGAEDMFQIEGSTMLQLEVSLYNRLQSMLWGEATQTADGQITEEGGHLGIALSPSKQLVGMAFQPVGDNTWITTWDFGGLDMTPDDLKDPDKSSMLFAVAKNLQDAAPRITTGVIDQIQKAQEVRMVPDMKDPNVVNSEKNLNDTKDNAAKKLQEVMNEVLPASIKETLNREIKAADDTYAAQVQSINNDRDAKLADAKKKHDDEVAAINAIPNPKTLAQLKRDNAAKIIKIKSDYVTKQTNLKKSYENKLAQIAKNAKDELAAYKKSLDGTFAAQVQKINNDRDAKLADAKKSYEAEVDAINAIPNQHTLAQLKKDNAAKIAKIEADYATKQAELKKGYEAKLASIAKAAEEELAAYKQSLDDAVKNSPEVAKYEAKIAELKKAHEDFVAANNDKLAKLHDQLFPKKTNTVVLGRGAAAKTISLAIGKSGSALATKTDANTATNQSNANTLPQTGNKNSGAIVALGAVAAMFGFGLAAKKREY